MPLLALVAPARPAISSSGAGAATLLSIDRWNGAIGQDTFLFTYAVEYVIGVYVNGLLLDALSYTVSVTQVVLDTPLAGDSIVSAQYVVATL
jgi:hypothetical protein